MFIQGNIKLRWSALRSTYTKSLVVSAQFYNWFCESVCRDDVHPLLTYSTNDTTEWPGTHSTKRIQVSIKSHTKRKYVII